MKITKPQMFIDTEKAKIKNIALQILIFIAVFIVIAIAESIIPFIMMFGDIAEFIYSDRYTGINQEYMNFIAGLQYQDKFMISMLLSTIFGTLIAVIYCRFIEKRSFSSIGFKKKNAIHDYLFGMLIGFSMLSAVVLLNIILGAIKFDGFNQNLNYTFALLYFLGFLIQGMSEEVIFRGYLMNSIGGKHSMFLAVLISSVVFSLAHAMNSGITILALFNIVLFGAFMALYMICFDNIWGASAIHSLWNFSQGNIFGISVSGTGSLQTIFKTSSSSSKTIINGGAFGIEGGICTTIVLIFAFVFLFMYMKKKNIVTSN